MQKNRKTRNGYLVWVFFLLFAVAAHSQTITSLGNNSGVIPANNSHETAAWNINLLTEAGLLGDLIEGSSNELLPPLVLNRIKDYLSK